MAHPCILCGSECDCNGDLDDVIISKTPKSCEGCGCEEFAEDQGWIDNGDEQEFYPCSKCDGHAACEDFGCAIGLGLAKMVKKNITPGFR
jgi:hypothetical protein